MFVLLLLEVNSIPVVKRLISSANSMKVINLN